MSISIFLKPVHASWLSLVKQALQTIPKDYLNLLETDNTWLPGPANMLRAFSEPLENTRYILFGESPYPRPASAIGYAFWDGMVEELWSPDGLSKRVNRATSLRHIMKMLLLADGALTATDLSQLTISQLDKRHYVKTGNQLFTNFLQHGFVLLNATPVLSRAGVKKDAIVWRPFVATILSQLQAQVKNVELILFGRVAELIGTLPEAQLFTQLCAEHPYNQSFITNKTVLNFFRPLQLLRNRQ